jgi:protein-L-isoaspartate(D-aspartate) O-methyltransferase
MLTGKAQLIDQLSARIGDRRVLAAIEAVPRDLFVPAALRAEAWVNTSLPIAEGQTISQPIVVARMCELLELAGDETVLDVGTGSGYHAAVLARLAARVISIERRAALSQSARAALAAAGFANVELVVGDGSYGYAPQAPYEAINVAAASSRELPHALTDQLAEGGRLVAPIDGGEQRLVRIRRRAGKLERERHEPVRFVPLVRGDDARHPPGRS